MESKKWILSFLLLFLGLSRSQCSQAHEKLNLSFGDEQRLDLYTASIEGLAPSERAGPGKTLSPLLVYFHGGAWQAGDKSQYQALGRAFSKEGISVAIVNYTLSAPGGPQSFPHFMEDAARAVDWLLKHAKYYSFNPHKIILSGHSAGAQIAALLALDPQYLRYANVKDEDFKPRALVLFEGIYDIMALVRKRPEYLPAFVQKAFGSSALGWSKASPQTYARTKTASSWFVVHSPLDADVDISQSRDFVSQLRAVSASVEFYTEISKGHFAVIDSLAEEKSPLREKVVLYIKSLADFTSD